MPKRLHDELVKAAEKKGLKGKAAKKFIYGTLNKITKKK